MKLLLNDQFDALSRAVLERDQLQVTVGEQAAEIAALSAALEEAHTPWWAARIINWARRRSPDFVIGGEERPYLLRWWLVPRNRFFNVYVHRFLRSDDDRALHDHPWANASLILRGHYVEHTIAAGGIHYRRMVTAGQWRVRWSGKIAHRVELTDGPCWTLFVTGPRYRQWGFHCDRGWVHWEVFTAAGDRGAIGKGCEP